MTTDKKLLAHFKPRERYVVHVKALQLYIRLGMTVTNVYRCLSFSQSYWLQPYILHNTEKRKAATASFQKDLFKLMNNGRLIHLQYSYRYAKLACFIYFFQQSTAKPWRMFTNIETSSS